MATLQTNALGIVEIAKRTNNGEILAVSEVLSRFDEILRDMPWVPANNIASHVHNRRLSEPTGSWRNVNLGVTPEASHVHQITENVGRLESWAQIDELTMSSILGDKMAFRATEEEAFIGGLAKTLTTAFITGDTTVNPERMDGLQIRTNALGTYVKGSGGSGGDTTSVYLIQWGPNRVHGIYQPDTGTPTQGSPLQVEDHGKEAVWDGTNIYDAFRTKFVVTAGLAVHDSRSLCRLTNIEDDPSGASIVEPDLLIQLLNSMFDRGRGAWMYAHQITLTQLDILALDKGNVNYTVDQIWGEPVTQFRSNIPIRQLDAIGITETAVT